VNAWEKKLAQPAAVVELLRKALHFPVNSYQQPVHRLGVKETVLRWHIRHNSGRAAVSQPLEALDHRRLTYRKASQRLRVKIDDQI